MGISGCLNNTEMTRPHCRSSYVLALHRDGALHIYSFDARLLGSCDIPQLSSGIDRARLRRDEHR